MKSIVVILSFMSISAWAQQGYLTRNDCDTITKELAMRPPGFGDRGRASYDYQSYQAFCTALPWSKMIGPNDLEALRPLVCTHGGLVDHVNNKLSCY